MRTILTAVAFVVAASLAGAADEKYASKDGKFSVGFPQGAKVKKDVKKAGGGIDMMMTTAEDSGKAFAVMYMDLPEAVKDVAPKLIFDGAEKGSATQSGGKVVESKDFEFGKGKLPAREFLLDKDGNKTKTWIIMNGTRLYVVVVGGPKDFATGKDGTTYLGSFEITK